MCVFGRNSYIFDGIEDKTCTVEPFDPTIGTAKEVPIVDAAVSCQCPITLETYILVAKNVLYVPTMEHNLIPPFILRESGVIVNDTAKIHLKNPTSDDHALIFPDAGLRIPLSLKGTFSVFETWKPTRDEIRRCDRIMITPDSYVWNPYSDHFSNNEAAITDYQGKVMDDRPPQLENQMEAIDHLETEYQLACARVVNEAFTGHILERECYCDDSDLVANLMCNEVEKSKMKISIGATSMNSKRCELFHAGTESCLDMSEVSSSKAVNFRTISKEELAKIWRIDEDLAEKAIQQNTHLNRRSASNDLSKQFSTNDRMLRYRRIQSQFFTDTFFVTKQGKSIRGYTCGQVFVSDKGYLAIYLMKSKSEFYDALHLFCKEVGVPITLVVDPSGEQTSNKVRKFCHQVGLTLRILEESTQWANRAELYIGLLKEAIRRDMRESDSPLVLWDYCAERRVIIHNILPRNLFQLQSSTPTEATFGIQGDISRVAQFGWYQ